MAFLHYMREIKTLKMKMKVIMGSPFLLIHTFQKEVSEKEMLCK